MCDDNFQQGKWHNGKMLSGTFKTFFSIYMLSVICRVMCVFVRKVKCSASISIQFSTMYLIWIYVKYYRGT